MTSAYYLRYGVWNVPPIPVEDIDFSSGFPMLIIAECRIVSVHEGRLITTNDNEPVAKRIRAAYGENLIFPDNGVFKFDIQSCTILNSRYEPVHDAQLQEGNSIKLKYMPCVRKLQTGDERVDFVVFDILNLER